MPKSNGQQGIKERDNTVNMGEKWIEIKAFVSFVCSISSYRIQMHKVDTTISTESKRDSAFYAGLDGDR